MPYYCTVPRCTSMAGKAKNVSFHQFPRDEELAKLWNRVLKRGKPYTKYSKVCSLHFKPEDYTITSAQKNRGQWRTLRKDAIPSRNLPSESPAEDWHRKNTSTFQLPTTLDTSVQHQMAQAIYVQTMLAMQAAGINETNNVFTHVSEQSSSSNSDTQNEDDNQTTIHQEIKNTIPPEKVTYECNQCSKCFKDPDVFILHQRNHVKTENNAEMLRANPILANLLKTDSENNKNVISIENQIMSALTENMANYLHNLSTIMTNTALDNSMHSIVKRQYGTDLIEADSSNSTNSEDLIKDTVSETLYCEEGSDENNSKFIDESDGHDVIQETGSGAL
ncbi:uncharacterized protein LOC125055625 [Pieris napi]|uniref:uncharacterized protein LOC125055625 n=1 Tax=Pieris napi TaxID=78633 RepID=UPI001FBAF7C8|nr:uncharacterized protein LOC125055625 [Pieris napi]